MAFRKIENIKWNSNNTGEAFGGYIYSLTVQMGYTDGPTKITLNIVNESGVYTAQDKNQTQSTFKELLSTREVNTLKIGELDPFYLHLVGYEIRTTVGQRVLTLQLSDTSVLLDKIFVGLINRHVAAKDQGPTGSSYGAVNVNTKVSGLKVRCIKCDGSSDTEIVTPGETLKTGATGNKPYDSIFREIDVVQSAQIAEKGKAYVEPMDAAHFKKDGGMIILGKEGFVEQECDIPEVDYNFTELLSALWEGNSKSESVEARYPVYINVAKVTDSKGIPTSTLPDRNTEYRQQYTGTLREVLNAWCSDFGYSFTWNLQSEQPEIIGIDLSKDRLIDPVTGKSYIENIKEVIEKIQNTANEKSAVIESITENASLENTYKAGYVSQYLKPAKTKESSRIYFKKKMFYNVPVEAITTPAERFYMPIADFMVTCALAKFSPELRRHHLYSMGVGNQSVRDALGITSMHPLSVAERNFVIANMEQSNMVDVVRKFEGIAGGYTMALVHVSEDNASKYEQWQANLANNFIGRFYFSPVDQEEVDTKNCDKVSEYINDTEVIAGGSVEKYPLDDHLDFAKLPYAEFMINPRSHTLQNVIPYIDVSKEGEHGYAPDSFLPGGTENKGDPTYNWEKVRGVSKQVYIFQKEAPWSSSSGVNSLEDEINALKAVTPIDNYNVTIMPITGTIKLMFRNLITSSNASGLGSGTKDVLKGSQSESLKLMIIPAARGMQKGFKVSPGISNAAKLGGALSDIYKPHYFNGAYLGNMLEKVYATQGDEEDVVNNPECVTKCETSLVERVCGHCNYDSDLNKMYVGYPSWTGWKQTLEDGKIEPIGVVAEYVMLWGGGVMKEMIFPVMQPYQGYVRRDVYRKKTIPSMKRILGSALPKPLDKVRDEQTTIDGVTNYHKEYTWNLGDYKNKSMGIKVIENLITNDADAVININNGDESQQQGIVQVIVPVGKGEEGDKWDDTTPDGKLKSMTLEQYHDKLYDKFLDDSLGSSIANENYSFTLVGLAFTEIDGLKDLLKPEKGLLNLGISVDENGTVSDISFGTRPPVNPKAQVFTKKIEPKMNVFGRS